MHDIRVWVLSGWLVVVFGGLASAQEPAGDDQEPSGDDQATAQALFDQGMALLEAKKFDEACAKFEASFEVYEAVGSIGKAAECYEKHGKTYSAWQRYQQTEQVAKKLDDTFRAKIAAERAAALFKRISHMTVSLPDGASSDHITITRNGEVIAPDALGKQFRIDPGPYTIVASAPGYEPWTSKIELGEAQTLTIVAPRLRRKRGGPLGRVGIAAMGLGVVAAAAGGYFGLRSSQQWNDAFDSNSCVEDTNVCTDRGFDLTESARSNATRANVLLPVGGVAVVTGLVLWWRSRPVRYSSEDSRIEVAPVVGAERVGLVMGGRF